MFNLTRNIDKFLSRNIEKHIFNYYSTSTSSLASTRDDEFRVLNLRSVKGQVATKRVVRKPEVLPPRTNQMAVDQDWGNVWQGPRSFHPATVPLPLRQGYVKKGAPPGKYANAELMKIPNFLHLTPPVIKRQCEALKRFCTEWPKGLETDEKCDLHFPIDVISSDYCYSIPTIREPLSRIVTIKLKMSSLNLNDRAKDKLRRLVDDRYNEDTDIITIVTDRCPTKKQNYDYAMYLITALYHESQNIEPWEELKSEADMEYYDWEKSASKQNIETLFGVCVNEIPNIEFYSKAVDKYMNDGENEYNIKQYGEAVTKLLNLAPLPE